MKKSFSILVAVCCLCSCNPFIHGAVRTNNLERVKEYVAEGHINDRDENFKHTPLIAATYYGHKPIVEYLCENGADLDAQAADGKTALIYAAYYNFADIAEILLDHGASVNIKDKDGHTALYYADSYRFDRIVDLLNQKDAVME